MDPSIVVTIVAALVIVFATALTMAVSLALPLGILWFMMKANQEHQKLLTEGDPGVGQVVSAHQTGVFVNHNPQVQVVLDVQPMDGEPYQATVLTTVQMISLPRVQPGTQVDVRIDPNNRNRIAIVGL